MLFPHINQDEFEAYKKHIEDAKNGNIDHYPRFFFFF
jgi:hypothetical protein